VYSAFAYNKDLSPTQFLCLLNHFKQLRAIWKCATVHDQTCPCLYWLRWRNFWTSVV